MLRPRPRVASLLGPCTRSLRSRLTESRTPPEPAVPGGEGDMSSMLLADLGVGGGASPSACSLSVTELDCTVPHLFFATAHTFWFLSRPSTLVIISVLVSV